MLGRLHIRWTRKPWLLAWLLAVFLSHALVPAGFMPGHGGVILCSGYAGLTSLDGLLRSGHRLVGLELPGTDLAAAGGARDAGGGGGPSHGHPVPCPFAAAGAGHAPPPQILAAAYALFVTDGMIPPGQSPAPFRRAVPTSLPRGPPRIS